eukprot:gene23808-9371_t
MRGPRAAGSGQRAAGSGQRASGQAGIGHPARALDCFMSNLQEWESCGENCVQFNEKSYNRRSPLPICLKWTVDGGINVTNGDTDDTYQLVLSGGDGMAAYGYNTCAELVNPDGTPTSVGRVLVLSNYGYGYIVDAITVTNMSCCSTNGCNAPLTLRFSGPGIQYLQVSNMVLSNSFFVVALSAISYIFMIMA